jgi:hypothetical protein
MAITIEIAIATSEIQIWAWVRAMIPRGPVQFSGVNKKSMAPLIVFMTVAATE